MLLEIIESHAKAVPSKCSVEKWIETLEPEEQTAFNGLVKSDTLNATSLFLAIETQIKLPFKITTFRSHMRGYCSCQQ
jgi:hypothetical protein